MTAKRPFCRQRIRKAAPIQLLIHPDGLVGTALATATKRFRNLPGVVAVGVGKTFSERLGKYQQRAAFREERCIKVLVERKHHTQRKPVTRIPKYLMVPDQRGIRRRVDLDVLAVGGRGTCLQSGRGYPTAGLVSPGRIFVIGRQPAAQLPPVLTPNLCEVGTAGALIKSGGRTYVASAAHVFLYGFCQRSGNERDRPPLEPLGICVSGNRWHATPSGACYPPNIRPHGLLRDAMIMDLGNAPHAGGQADVWPEGFLHSCATLQDMRAAIDDEHESSFIWVERIKNGKVGRVKLPVDVQAALHDATLAPCGRAERYGRTWALRFPERKGSDPTTIGGDSGAGVFVPATDKNGYRLLGFHFMESYRRIRRGDTVGWYSFAADAGDFFLSVLNAEPGVDFTFA